jgi:transposase-like protein
MTEERLPLAELLAKAGDGDFLRGAAEAVVQLLMETDVEGLIGAGRHERSGDRTTYRNGYRDRTLDTRLGSLQLRIPKLRQGSYFPSFLEPRKTSEKALVAVIQEAWVGGVSTRRVDDLVQAMGLAGISKSTVSKLCKDIDDRVSAFLDRPLAGEWPYLWLDATYLKQREGGRIVSVAAIIAVAANTEGKREIVGLHIGPSEAETFWATFLKSMLRRGLRGVKLVISDAHEGLKAAIRRVVGASWQRCRVPSPGFMPGVPSGTDRSLIATGGCAMRWRMFRQTASGSDGDDQDHLRAGDRRGRACSVEERRRCVA